MSVEKYSGKEPYIFISYAHKDTNKVMPIIERLDKDGYRIWYDEGIPTAARFNDVIAERIDSCAFMLLFVSDSYIASDYCNKELNLAEQEKKKLICIYARGVNLTPRFKMLKANYQGIKEPYMYDDSFFESIRDSEDISICLKNRNIYLSFSSDSVNLVDSITEKFEKTGYSIGRFDKCLTIDECSRKVNDCQLFILFASQAYADEYRTSFVCHSELTIARMKEKRIIVVDMDDTKPSQHLELYMIGCLLKLDYKGEDDFFEEIKPWLNDVQKLS